MYQYPWIKFRLIDLTDMTIDHFTNRAKSDWFYDMNSYFGPNNASRQDLPLKIKEWADLIHSGKKLCMLYALDKPRIRQSNGKFIFNFIDLIDVSGSVKSMAGKQPYVDELFYWTPDKPEIVIKQAHLIKNYLKAIDPTKLNFVSLEKSDLAYVEYQGQRWWLSNHGVHQLIYPGWDINTFSVGKTPSLLFPPRDNWFFKMQESIQAKKNWEIGIKKMWQLLPDYWKNTPTDIYAGVKLCWSKDYFLEEI